MPRRLTIQRPDGAWFHLATPTRPGWTDNPHLSYTCDRYPQADATLQMIFTAGLANIDSGDHPAIMERIQVTFTDAPSIPMADRARVPGNQHIDWTSPDSIVPTDGTHYFPQMDAAALAASLVEDGWTRVELPGRPGELVFERPADY